MIGLNWDANAADQRAETLASPDWGKRRTVAAVGTKVASSALVVDMERQSGFRELMTRVGKERVAGQRFGRRYDHRSLATTSEMDLLTEWISGTIEDWVYSLFREDQALTRPGNQQLYLLLCDFRCNLKKSLASVLRGAFAFDPEECSAEDTLLFSGCYLAATGERADQRAFVGGILKKLSDEQEILEWTTDTLLEQQRWERISTGGLVMVVLMPLWGSGSTSAKRYLDQRHAWT